MGAREVEAYGLGLAARDDVLELLDAIGYPSKEQT